MAVLQDGVTPAIVGRIDPPYGAQRFTAFPHASLGAYRVATQTGLLTGLAANTEIFQFRWTETVNLAILKFLRVRYSVITGFTAAQELAFDAHIASGWSVVGSGGTAIVPASTNLMRRSTYPISKVQDMRIATTAALGAGTKTALTNAMLASSRKTLAAAATVQDCDFEEVIDLTQAGEDPIILNQNEGVVVRNLILMGAGGTVRATVTLGWSEILATNYPTL